MADRRYTRQVRLAEIGEEGQERLGAARVALGARGFARTIEERYLRSAGLTPADGGRVFEVDVELLGLTHVAAREVGEGALRALATLRGVLEVG